MNKLIRLLEQMDADFEDVTEKKDKDDNDKKEKSA